MTRLLDDPELVRRMGEGSRALAVSRFSVEIVNKIALDVLEGGAEPS